MKLKTKDYIFLGMATVLSLVIYMIAMVLSSFLGAFGHSISPGIWGAIRWSCFRLYMLQFQ